MSHVLLSAQEVHALKRMCNDPVLETGMTLRPKHLACFNPIIATSSMMTIIKFEKQAHATKWNNMHEERIRGGGHLATIALALLVGANSSNFAYGHTIASASGMVKDEVTARAWYPKMSKGWMLTRHFMFRYEQFPGKHFYMQWTDAIQDETGKEREKYKHGQSHCSVGGPTGIPEKLARDLISKTPKCRTIYYK